MPRFRILQRVGLIAVGLAITGCGREMAYESNSYRPAEDASVEVAAAVPVGNEAESAVVPSAVPRKIIYEADISLVVERFEDVQRQLPELVTQYGGYVADVSIDRIQGERRVGRWRTRIPVDQYDKFKRAVAELGVPESFRQTAEDVTERYVDLERRITNKKKLEDRILKLLETPESKLKDVIEVERELARVRTEVEQLEGSLQSLARRAALATLTVTVREHRGYTPPAAPTLGGRISQAWDDSLLALRTFGENLLVVVVFIAPWVILLVVLVLIVSFPMWCLSRWRRRAGGRRDSGSGGGPSA
jgi:hypothetical protein